MAADRRARCAASHRGGACRAAGGGARGARSDRALLLRPGRRRRRADRDPAAARDHVLLCPAKRRLRGIRDAHMSRTVPLYDLAHARTGDKGDRSNISVIAYDPTHWDLLVAHVTEARVAELFAHRRP